MSYIQRNQSDLPLTHPETSDFMVEENMATGDQRRGSNKKRQSVVALGRESRLGSGTGPPIRTREQWGSKFEFIFSCMAFSVGLGNVSTIFSVSTGSQVLLMFEDRV